MPRNWRGGPRQGCCRTEAIPTRQGPHKLPGAGRSARQLGAGSHPTSEVGNRRLSIVLHMFFLPFSCSSCQATRTPEGDRGNSHRTHAVRRLPSATISDVRPTDRPCVRPPPSRAPGAARPPMHARTSHARPRAPMYYTHAPASAIAASRLAPARGSPCGRIARTWRTRAASSSTGGAPDLSEAGGGQLRAPGARARSGTREIGACGPSACGTEGVGLSVGRVVDRLCRGAVGRLRGRAVGRSTLTLLTRSDDAPASSPVAEAKIGQSEGSSSRARVST